ncbi:hypothetical protein J2X48_004537 [Bosea sp. BE271]|uniref:hypothetical protein n=1 Tax=Bosea TaxID=85413 RepID=UPI00285A7B84|nr:MULTISPECIES: hypothetical protein [Bosea]MDR6830919.1 hypothetical protein [Bosea robiniae]MDR6897703.1 hypothetical protein [Bosea sp. BE109]MDR7141100.1 hypothetical protein [Bosea sp. BE168]MDR7177590.1 hypothetical protein [Bosea sp. BE271]
MFMKITNPLRPRYRQEMFQVEFKPNATMINAVKAILVGTYEGRFKLEEIDHFFPPISYDWLDDNLADADATLDELILRGYVWEMMLPAHDDCSVFGLTTDGELWATEFLKAPEDLWHDEEETLEYLAGLDWIRKSDPRAASLSPVGRGKILTSHIHNPNGKQIKLTHWVAQASYTHAESHAALARVDSAVEARSITLKAAGQYKRRIRERTVQ